MCGCEDMMPATTSCLKFLISLVHLVKDEFFFCMDHPVCDEEIKINYDKDQFGHLIYEYACEILKKFKKVALVLLRGT